MIHCGDCMDPISGLPSLSPASVDHVITDPPYEAEAHNAGRRKKTRGAVERVATSAPIAFPPITAALRVAVAAQIGRVCRGWAVVFCQVEAVTAWRDALQAGGMLYRRTLPWVKPDAMPALHGRWPGQSFETIVLAQAKGSEPCPGGGKAVWYQHTRAKGGQPGGPGGTPAPHPTTKPLPLMLDLVDLVARPGDIICDPFAGSGTTGIAAAIRGLGFLGWEIDPAFAEVARRRMAGGEATVGQVQRGLFDEP